MGWLILFQAIAFGVLSVLVATRKGRDKFAWLLIGFFFGVFGFIAALVVGNLQRAPDTQGSVGAFSEAEATKRCPQCAETIKAQASVCRYCGRSFTPEEVGASVAAAQAKHSVARLRQWIRGLTHQEQIEIIDRMAKNGAEQGILPPFTATYRKLSPAERENRKAAIKALPDEKWVELARVAMREV